MPVPELCAEQLQSYERDGFVVLRDFVPTSITDPVLQAVGHDALSVVDSDGNSQELNTWTWCGDDLIGRLPRSQPLVSLAEALIGGPVHHWHSKISWKRPGTAGTWDWHQDYAFWLEEGCQRPAMTTLGIALDHHDVDNGCLQVVRGSHLLGNIAHPRVGASRAADPGLLEELATTHETVDVVLAPGDAIAFHCNTLHGSGPNNSTRQRTFLHCSWNAVDNPATQPLVDGHQPHALDLVPESALAPGSYEHVFGATRFIRPEDAGYSGRSGYQVKAAT